MTKDIPGSMNILVSILSRYRDLEINLVYIFWVYCILQIKFRTNHMFVCLF